MAVHVLKNTKIYIDGVDLSGRMNSVTLNYTAELKDKTVFGSSYRKRLMGLFSVEMSGQGFYDASSAYSGDKILWDDVGSTDQITSIVAEGTALGNIVYSAQKLSNEYTPSYQIGEIASISFACYGQGALIRQRTMQIGNLSTATSFTVRNLGYRPPLKALYGTMHVTRGCSSGGDRLVVKVQTASSSGFSSPTTAMKFTALTTASGHTAQWKSTASSTAHQWYRIRINSSGGAGAIIGGIVTLGIQ